MDPSERKALFSLLSAAVSLHDKSELHITGYHSKTGRLETRKVQILKVMGQISTLDKVDSAFKGIHDLHKLSAAERSAYVGLAIRHTIKLEIKDLKEIKSVQLKQITSNRSTAAMQEMSPEADAVDLDGMDLTELAKALANMSDAEFKLFLEDSEPNRPLPQILEEHGKKLALSLKKDLPLTATPEQIRDNKDVKAAVSKLVTAICKHLLAERREEASREEKREEAKREIKNQIESKELQREIIKSWILEADRAKSQLMRAIIETLKENQIKENRAEEKQAREDDLTPVAGILVELVWSALPKAIKSTGLMGSPSAFDVNRS